MKKVFSSFSLSKPKVQNMADQAKGSLLTKSLKKWSRTKTKVSFLLLKQRLTVTHCMLVNVLHLIELEVIENVFRETGARDNITV